MISLLSCWQVSAIKERVKAITSFEREITKYVDEGKDEYKEVTCVPLSYMDNSGFE